MLLRRVVAASALFLLASSGKSSAQATPDIAGGDKPERSWAVGGTVQSGNMPGGIQVGHRWTPYREVVFGATVGRPGVSLAFGDSTGPFGVMIDRFRYVYTAVGTRAGVRFASREGGSGVYALPFVALTYNSEYSDDFAAALEREDRIRDSRDWLRPHESGTQLDIGAELGYRFHFLRFFYGDAAGYAKVDEVFGENRGSVTFDIRLGLGVRF